MMPHPAPRRKRRCAHAPRLARSSAGRTRRPSGVDRLDAQHARQPALPAAWGSAAPCTRPCACPNSMRATAPDVAQPRRRRHHARPQHDGRRRAGARHAVRDAGADRLTRLSDMMTAAGLRTQRGTAFSPAEVKRVLDRLLAGSHAARDAPGARARGRAAWHGAFRADDARPGACHGLVRRLAQAGAVRPGLLAGLPGRRTAGRGDAAGDLWRRHARSCCSAWPAGLQLHAPVERRVAPCACCSPSTPMLFARLEPGLRTHLAEQMLLTLSGLVGITHVRPLEDWLLALPPKDARACRPRCAAFGRDAAVPRRRGGRAALVRRHSTSAGPGWCCGARPSPRATGKPARRRFEAAWKMVAAELGRRKNLASPAIGWIYVMALLALPTPAAWTKARKFVAAEAGKRDAADPFGFWGVWVDAIDQRLGDAPKAHGHFRTRAHRALDACSRCSSCTTCCWRPGCASRWPNRPICVRTHAAWLAQEYDEAGMPGRHGWHGARRPRCWARRLNRPMPGCRSSSGRHRTAGARRWPRSWRWAVAQPTRRAMRRPPRRIG